jgi:hypothetical protein
VIDATITANDGIQIISISKSSGIEDPDFISVTGCKVWVENEKGNYAEFFDYARTGKYSGTMDDCCFLVGSKWRLRVRTPEGNEYLSTYEELMPNPPVGDVYYQLETKPTSDPDVIERGLQFYINFKANNQYGRFYRWQLTQTYEYHSTWPLDRWLDYDGTHDLKKPDYSNFVCYKTDRLNNIFVLSTDGFTQNNYPAYQFHFVKDQTQQLQHKYSLLVRQFAISEGAHHYWENLRKNNQESVDLFGKQPANIKGNIRNVKDSTELALGYFSLATVTEKRIMVLPIKGLLFDHVYRCHALVIDGPLPPDRPIYFAIDEDANGVRYTGIAGEECIFCTKLGGTTEKPAYWDEQ